MTLTPALSLTPIPGKQWKNFWASRQKTQPCGNQCVYSVVISVTKRVGKAAKGAQCDDKHREGLALILTSILTRTRILTPTLTAKAAW